MVAAYQDELDAARGLLCETAELLNGHGIDHVIIGGWIPYLFATGPLPHPGTFDVDVLLNEQTPLAEVVAALDHLRAHGYRRAAKNRFQLFRTLTVLGEPVDFHVDFLHRKYADGQTRQIKAWGPYQSISGPGSDVVFVAGERFTASVEGLLPDGSRRAPLVHFCSEVGFLSTRGRSVGFGKRTRDSYDVFLLLRQSKNHATLTERCSTLMTNPIFKHSMNMLNHEFREGRATDDAVGHLMELTPLSKAEAFRLVHQTVDPFLTALGFPASRLPWVDQPGTWVTK